MEDQGKCVMPDYEAECRRLREQNEKMSQEIKAMQHHFEIMDMERKNEAALLKARLDMVYLIFGGRNYG